MYAFLYFSGMLNFVSSRCKHIMIVICLHLLAGLFSVSKRSRIFVDSHIQLSLILGPFMLDVDYLLVPDYNQQIIYQMMPQSGDVRSLPMNPSKPVSLVFDPKIKGIYVTCQIGDHFGVQKTTFDGRINQVIYYSSDGTLAENILITTPCRYSSSLSLSSSSS